MLTLYIILLILILLSIKSPTNSISLDFCGKETSNIIKGIFIWLVFISHLSQYIQQYHPQLLNYGVGYIKSFLGQMIVVPFLFYSGYGIMLSIKNKGINYIDKIPSKRVMSVLLNFDVAVIIYIIIDFLLGITLSSNQIILSLIAWDSVGNSNWYIFTILILYLISYLSSKILGYSLRCVISICGLVCFYSLVMYFFKDSWWYDTTFAYAFGSLYCFYKKQADQILTKFYYTLLIVTTCIFVLLIFPPNVLGIVENIRSLFLSVIILLITMKVPLKNKFLSWSGKNLFPIYIYQRLPMILFSMCPLTGLTLVQQSPFLYIVSCIVITITITYFHKYFSIKL